MTDQEIQDAIEYQARKMLAEEVNLQSIEEVVKWMVQNPLPDKATRDAELGAVRDEEKAARIEALNAELDKLEGRTR